ncbi:tumor protein p53-inducible nuclear protein 2-like isoform 1-T1 [Salvelinus alpinus]|uniref:tumor protein p53-inducible nuclear protein 2-like isoform X1 n=1 Tax=Salvelinus alpinus TaxID=8036 RepID=UPI0039FC5A9A
MIGKIFAHFLGSTDNDFSTDDNETYEELIEFEEGGWVVINIQENNSLNPPEEDPLENLLIEHPSMSVYQIRHQTSDEEDSDEEDASPRPVPVKQHVSWRLAAWGSPLPCNVQLLAIQQARTHVECKKLTRSAFQRQNLAKMRFSPSDRRFGHFKQPCQRLYNY